MTGGLSREPGAEPEAVADARRWGMSAEDIAAIRDQLIGGDGWDGVWPENVAAVRAFVLAGTQWRTAPGERGVRLLFLGLDYAAALAGIEAAGIEVTPDTWLRLRVMEQAAAAAANGTDF